MPRGRRHPRSGHSARVARRGRREDHDRHSGEPGLLSALPRERVIAAVDAERGDVVVEGWRTATGTPVLERIRDLAPVVGGFLFTQVEKEGAMSGFDFQAVAAAVRAAGEVRLTAAGGITTATEI